MMTLEDRPTSEEICVGIVLSMVEVLERSGVDRSEAIAEAIEAMRVFYDSGAAGPAMSIDLDAVEVSVLQMQGGAARVMTR